MVWGDPVPTICVNTCPNIVLPQWMRMPQTHYIHNSYEYVNWNQSIMYTVIQNMSTVYPKHHLMTTN